MKPLVHRLVVLFLGASLSLAWPLAAAADEVLEWNVAGYRGRRGWRPEPHHAEPHPRHGAARRPRCPQRDRPPVRALPAREPSRAPVGPRRRHRRRRARRAGRRDPGFGTPEQRAKALELLDDRPMRARSRKCPTGPARRDGLAAGQAAAAAMLQARAQDGATTDGRLHAGHRTRAVASHAESRAREPADADAGSGGGQPACHAPQWATLTPFTMASPWQFRLPGPPKLDSETVRARLRRGTAPGRQGQRARTPEQTEIARYWYEGSPQGWSRIARVVSAQRGLDRWDNARLLALVHAAMADGFVAGADTRYLYNFWRPVTAIRAGDTDGNDATTADPAWETFLNTPRPARLSLHAQRAGRRGGDGPGALLRGRSGDLQHDERTALPRHHPLLRELLAGRARKRRLARLRGAALPQRLPGRRPTRRADRAADIRRPPPAVPKVAAATGRRSSSPRSRPRPASCRPDSSRVARTRTWSGRWAPSLRGAPGARGSRRCCRRSRGSGAPRR